MTQRSRNLDIRRLTRPHITAVQKLLMLALSKGRDRYYPQELVKAYRSMYTVADLERRVLSHKAVAFGAFQQGMLVGFLWGSMSAAGDFYAEWGVVHPSVRRRGIFTKLLATVESEVAKHRAYKFWFYVSSKNIPALRCYVKAGYKIEGLHPNHFFGWNFVTVGKILRRKRWPTKITRQQDVLSAHLPL